MSAGHPYGFASLAFSILACIALGFGDTDHALPLAVLAIWAEFRSERYRLRGRGR